MVIPDIVSTRRIKDLNETHASFRKSPRQQQLLSDGLCFLVPDAVKGLRVFTLPFDLERFRGPDLHAVGKFERGDPSVERGGIG